ncbi:SGNH/GDSL hydrolase family protein [Microbacterium sp. BK668]|uniref:SGNH/GDSL hydrolase family protein n=1 Tax=Microbacterium sp. BK668 TaxID=2512118 RepID=UPI00105BB536|nr:SGNH/GDSL hydrolase family protein [Microbacterium sp. BK668]TDN90860.1 GDSL-like lipase/acylhydrolase family protein [Microbacterium sp. BK668]
MKRRIIAALAALGLAAGMALAVAPAAQSVEPAGSPYVALGDSEAAGTGNLPYVDQSCLRSKKAYPSVLAASLGTSVVSAACAGADTDDVLLQVATLAATGDLGPATQLVTLTAGFNNVDWGAGLAACGENGDPLSCQQALLAAQQAVQALPVQIATIIGAIRTAAPNAQIVVTGYPLLFGDVTNFCAVGASQGAPVKFTAEQTMLVNSFIEGVNAAVAGGVAGYQQQTGDPGILFVDVAAGFDGHGLCDTGDRWISGLVSGKTTSDRGLHPNTAGQQAWAALIADALVP